MPPLPTTRDSSLRPKTARNKCSSDCLPIAYASHFQDPPKGHTGKKIQNRFRIVHDAGRCSISGEESKVGPRAPPGKLRRLLDRRPVIGTYATLGTMEWMLIRTTYCTTSAAAASTSVFVQGRRKRVWRVKN
jgi:hypothetical protein